MSILLRVVADPPIVDQEQRFWVRISPTQTWATLFDWVASTLNVSRPCLRLLHDGIPLYADRQTGTLLEDYEEPLTIDIVYREPYPEEFSKGALL